MARLWHLAEQARIRKGLLHGRPSRTASTAAARFVGVPPHAFTYAPHRALPVLQPAQAPPPDPPGPYDDTLLVDNSH